MAFDLIDPSGIEMHGVYRVAPSAKKIHNIIE